MESTADGIRDRGFHRAAEILAERGRPTLPAGTDHLYPESLGLEIQAVAWAHSPVVPPTRLV